MITRISVVGSIALALLLLTGCSGVAETAGTTPAPSASTPPETLDDLAVGDMLTDAQAKQLNGQVGTQRPYQQDDGSYIVIDIAQPLPESVRQEVAASIATSDSSDLASFFRKTDEESVATGKTLIVVRYMSASTPDGEPLTAWMASSAATGFPGFHGTSAEDVAAQAQTWASTTRDASQYEVVVIDG